MLGTYRCRFMARCAAAWLAFAPSRNPRAYSVRNRVSPLTMCSLVHRRPAPARHPRMYVWNKLNAHDSRQTVHGKVHTANLDSFWSLLKRGVVGTFHHVSYGYLPLYVGEFSFRHNHRDNPDIFTRLVESC